MKKDLKIHKVEIDENLFNSVDLEPFIFPSLSVFVGSVAAGKTTTLYNLIKITDEIFNGNVILISPTIKNDPILMKMVDEEMIIEYFEEYSNESMKKILNVIKEEEANEKYLIVMDDILSMTPRNNTREARWWNSFISTYRHGGGICGEGQISLMFFTQYYKDMGVVIRSNMSYMGLLGVHSEKHIKSYAEELSAPCNGTEEGFYDCYKKAKCGKFDFLFLDFRKLRAFRNLDEKLYDRDEDYENKEKCKVIEDTKDSEDNSE